MELKFDSNLEYQKDAINSVIDLFKGQSVMSSRFTLVSRSTIYLEEGKGNKWDISPDEIEENFREVQRRNGLDENANLKSLDFTIEMETGTGKTYVYLRTILELNKNYGFSKFVIVVPSIAIKEGVKKTIDVTRNHFRELYNNISYNDFVFNSSNLTQLEDFAREDNIQIMIITIQSFNREANKIRQKNEYGVVPINFISDTNPIVIIDEPQSTASTNKQKEAISNLNSLFTLQYSATPRNAENLIYKLDAVQAYNKHLVKTIEVDAFESADYQGKPYIQLLKTKSNKNGKRTAEMMLIENTKTGFKKNKINGIEIGNSLKYNTNNDTYEGYTVKDISVNEDKEFVEFTNGQKVYLNQIINDINQEEIKKDQIEETIREHLNKELNLAEKNIKVLSLFFIDEVKNYREYTDEGPRKGKYALWFEKIYNDVIQEDDYQKLPDYIKNMDVEEVHDGYFSGDKKWTNTSGTTNKDNSTYEKIMMDKEKILNPKDNLRFIFSHSALKEGWDNPNVFQICTFIETQSDLSKRQKIGRGLRLCVDGEGNRVDENYGEEFKSINRLTVLANESFDNFADSLQKEMEEEGIKFSVIHKNDFVGIEYEDDSGRTVKTTSFDSERIIKSLIEQKLINKSDLKIKKGWEEAVKEDKVIIPEKYDSIKNIIFDKVSSKLPSNSIPIKNKKDRVTIKLDESKFNSDNFNKLWDKIKYKTKYSVKLNTDKLIEDCVRDMAHELNQIQKSKIIHTVSDLTMGNEVSGITRSKRSHFVDTKHDDIPNIVKNLQDKTHLTRKTIIDILVKSDERNKTFDKLLLNPNEYFNRTLDVIKTNLEHSLIEDIEYVKLTGEDNEYDKSHFVKEFTAYLDDKKLVKCSKSIYDFIYCDSTTVEPTLARNLDSNEDVKLFIKLPDWFAIRTPSGLYNPDWAIILNVNGSDENYFVIETKGTTKKRFRRESENDKIICGKKHFDALDVTYDAVVTCDEFLEKYAIE